MVPQAQQARLVLFANFNFQFKFMDIDKEFDTIIQVELKKRLKRDPLPSEIINADNDSDLVNETMWQLLLKLNDRINVLEKKP